jgi:hypothetical protein
MYEGRIYQAGDRRSPKGVEREPYLQRPLQSKHASARSLCVSERPKTAAPIIEWPGAYIVPLNRYPYKIFYRVLENGVRLLHKIVHTTTSRPKSHSRVKSIPSSGAAARRALRPNASAAPKCSRKSARVSASRAGSVKRFGDATEEVSIVLSNLHLDPDHILSFQATAIGRKGPFLSDPHLAQPSESISGKISGNHLHCE